MAKRTIEEISEMSGMTVQESKIMDLTMEANDLFQSLESTHPNELTDWISGIHKLQYVMSMRTLRREHPDYYCTIK